MAAGVRRALTEEQVNALVHEAKEDVEECLISPIWAYINYQPWPLKPGALRRQHARAMAVMGMATRGASFLKSTGLSVLVFGGLLAALLFNSQFGWLPDLVFAFLFAFLLSMLVRINNQYREAFARIVVHEHRDFTDPAQTTAKLSAWVPRLTYYDRPDVWKGQNDRNGVSNPASSIVVQTRDSVVWAPDVEEKHEDGNLVIVRGETLVERARKVTEIRETKDLLNLPAEKFAVTGAAARARRFLLRLVQRNGLSIESFEKGEKGAIERNLEWIYCAGCLVLTFLLFLFSGG